MKYETSLSRRNFIKSSAAASLAAAATSTGVFAAGSDTIRIALIGCGGRGTGAAINCLDSSDGLELVAMADLFEDRLDGSLSQLKGKHGDKVKVKSGSRFLGFDAYKKVLAMQEVDVVLLCTPPGFRPEMVRAAVEAGKHIFMEKPGAVDPVGVRSLIKSAEIADKKGLCIAVGTQQRCQPQYQEIIKRIHDGQLGKITGGQAYWNWGFTDWHFHNRQSTWSDMEWQIRCWPYFVWLSGDHIVEQHLHNMDIINWAIGAHPISCVGFGGRQARTSPAYGNIYDHFVIEYVYPEDVRVMSMCSQIKGSNVRVGERVVGAKGTSWTTRQGGYIKGDSPYEYQGNVPSGFVIEHADLIKSIRNGKQLNQCKRLAESTLTLIMGRLAAYTGRMISWDFAMNKSQLDLGPSEYKLGELPVAPVAVPGETELI
ncbi:MAG: Gfo/Idh/MocA family oxidoreductase [Verrucomicrobia bacterium]|nr:Gfo/Idh/MocA family oxidoreductase [Verrucomicrobiota bacterium]